MNETARVCVFVSLHPPPPPPCVILSRNTSLTFFIYLFTNFVICCRSLPQQRSCGTRRAARQKRHPRTCRPYNSTTRCGVTPRGQRKVNQSTTNQLDLFAHLYLYLIQGSPAPAFSSESSTLELLFTESRLLDFSDLLVGPSAIGHLLHMLYVHMI